MNILWLDLETYSETPIAHGTHIYAANAEITLFAWAIDNGPVNVWDVTTGAPIPPELSAALLNDSVTIYAHNSHFDRTVLRTCMNSNNLMWHAAVTSDRWRDTMVKALSHSMPGALGTLCDLFKINSDQAKDKEGRQLVMLFCKPRPKNSALRRATRETHPVEWAKFIEYARRDIEAMREINKKLPEWNYRGAELELWHLDQRINDRGVQIDLDLVHAAITAINEQQAALAKRTQELTNDQVQAATQRDAMLRHLAEAFGVTLPDMQKSTLERRIDDPNLPAPLRELLAIRLQASTTSTAKYKTLIEATSADGRLRGTLQFNGASRTGRWAGRKFQPQNLPRPSMSNEDIDMGIEALKAGCADMVFSPDKVMELTSSAIRGCIVAPAGKKLVVSDLSNIEGRAQAWLAGEKWKLQAFRDYDLGTGHDLYKLAYAKSFGIKPEAVTKDQRQVGKVQELALGYEGGVGAFLTFAAAYGIDLEAMAEQALPSISPDILNDAKGALEWTKRQHRTMHGLSTNAWLVCESFKRAWREAHPNISSMWKELSVAVFNAIEAPGSTFTCRKVKVNCSGSWLRILLPSGRFLCYPKPKVEDGKITYLGVNQYSRKWERLSTYGGKLFENINQAAARDVLTHNMPTIEQAGYRIVLTVHDEVICEAPDTSEYNAEHLSSLLASNPPWAADMPLAAGGFESYRYKKD